MEGFLDRVLPNKKCRHIVLIFAVFASFPGLRSLGEVGCSNSYFFPEVTDTPCPLVLVKYTPTPFTRSRR